MGCLADREVTGLLSRQSGSTREALPGSDRGTETSVMGELKHRSQLTASPCIP